MPSGEAVDVGQGQGLHRGHAHARGAGERGAVATNRPKSVEEWGSTGHGSIDIFTNDSDILGYFTENYFQLELSP